MNGPTGPRARILIIDDEDEIRTLLQELLEFEGHLAETAADGQDGLNRLRGYSDGELPSLILLDLTMPVMDGATFRHEQQRDPRLAPIPVVVLSADAHIEEKARTMGARALLRKPIEFDRLMAVIARETGDSRESALDRDDVP